MGVEGRTSGRHLGDRGDNRWRFIREKRETIVGAPVTVTGLVMVMEPGLIMMVEDCSVTETEVGSVNSSTTAAAMVGGSEKVGGGELRVTVVGSTTVGTVAAVTASGMDGSMTENRVETVDERSNSASTGKDVFIVGGGVSPPGPTMRQCHIVLEKVEGVHGALFVRRGGGISNWSAEKHEAERHAH